MPILAAESARSAVGVPFRSGTASAEYPGALKLGRCLAAYPTLAAARGAHRTQCQTRRVRRVYRIRYTSERQVDWGKCRSAQTQRGRLDRGRARPPQPPASRGSWWQVYEPVSCHVLSRVWKAWLSTVPFTMAAEVLYRLPAHFLFSDPASLRLSSSSAIADGANAGNGSANAAASVAINSDACVRIAASMSAYP